MTLKQEVIDLLNSVVSTDEDQEAFQAGYDLSKDHANGAQLGGSVVRHAWGGVHVSMDIGRENRKGTWLERPLERDGTSILVENPAFVLGSVVAALESQQGTAESQA